MRKFVLGIMGPSRCGKDEAAEHLSSTFGLRYDGTTSIAISQEYAKRHDLTFDQAHEIRHVNRSEWRRLGDELRIDDPAALARTVLCHGSNLLVGVRSLREILAVRREHLCDLIVWVERPGVDVDPTLEFDSTLCDIIIRNDSTLDAYHARLNRLALALGFNN